MTKKLSTVTSNEQAMAFIDLARATLESGEKIIDLNLRQTKENLEDSAEALSKLLSASDPQTYAALAMEQSRQSFAKMFTQATELANLASSTQASLALAFGSSMQRSTKQQ